MANKIFQKDETVVYANERYSVLFSNGTTTKLIAEGEKVKRFEFRDPETGKQESVETNTIYCETDSVFLKQIKAEQEQLHAEVING